MPKEAYYFSHDTNARTDPKIMAMVLEYKSEGYGLYWSIVEMLSEQNEYKLKLNKITFSAIAMTMLCDTITVQKFINSCISDYELFEVNEECFWSNSLIRRMVLKEKKRQKRVEAGKKGAEGRWNNGNSIAIADQPHSIGISKDGKGKEIKLKEIKEKYSITFYDEIINAYNNTCISLPKVKQLSVKRKIKLKSRTEELKTIEEFKEIFDRVETSDFLKGDNKNNWKCSFDWLIENDNNYVKVLEGQYDGTEIRVPVNTWDLDG